MKTAGRGVPATPELSAGVQFGKNEFEPGEPALRFDIHRDPAPAVRNGDAPVAMQRDFNPVAVTGERLIDGVVDDLPEAVHQPARIRRTDIHARTLANRLEPFEDGEVSRGITRVCHCWNLL